MIWIIALCSIAVAWLDYLATKKFLSGRQKLLKWVLGALWAIDAMPFIFSLGCFLFTSDNPTELHLASGWISFAYMVLVISHAPLSLCLALSKRAWLWLTGGVAMVGAMAIFIYSMVITRTDYEVRRVVIESAELPESFDGYRIVQISDLHIGTLLKPEQEITQIAEICNELQPDMVAFTGDLVNIRYSELSDSVCEALKKFRYKDSFYSIIGNHDLGGYIKDSISLTQEVNTERLLSRERSLGWRVLDNQTEYIKRGADSIAITGISFPKELHEDRHSSKLPDIGLDRIYGDVAKGVFNITLCHIPQLWEDILALHPVNLTLSGHVHAMQMILTVGNMRISPSRIQYKRWSGLYEKQGHYLYINDGIGYVMYPMRVGARPEITLFELRSKK